MMRNPITVREWSVRYARIFSLCQTVGDTGVAVVLGPSLAPKDEEYLVKLIKEEVV
jgi:hypothetical protein